MKHCTDCVLRSMMADMSPARILQQPVCFPQLHCRNDLPRCKELYVSHRARRTSLSLLIALPPSHIPSGSVQKPLASVSRVTTSKFIVTLASQRQTAPITRQALSKAIASKMRWTYDMPRQLPMLKIRACSAGKRHRPQKSRTRAMTESYSYHSIGFGAAYISQHNQKDSITQQSCPG